MSPVRKDIGMQVSFTNVAQWHYLSDNTNNETHGRLNLFIYINLEFEKYE